MARPGIVGYGGEARLQRTTLLRLLPRPDMASFAPLCRGPDERCGCFAESRGEESHHRRRGLHVDRVGDARDPRLPYLAAHSRDCRAFMVATGSYRRRLDVHKTRRT